MTSRWNLLLVFTIVTFTLISNPNQVHCTPLTKRQELGVVGETVNDDLSLVPILKRRQSISNLGNLASPESFQNSAPLEAINSAIQLSEKVASAELQQELGSGNGVQPEVKRRRQLVNTFQQDLVTVDGNDEDEPCDDLLSKRSPLAIGGFAPSALGGSSTTSPLVSTGDILKRQIVNTLSDGLDTNDLYDILTNGATKRSPLAIGGFAPSALGGSSTTSPLIQVGNILKRSPLSLNNLPVLSSLESLLSGEQGGEDPLSELTQLLKKRSPLSLNNLPVLSSLEGLLNGEEGGENPLDEITQLLKKRFPLSLNNLPVLSSLEGLLNGEGGGEDPLSELTCLSKKRQLLPQITQQESLLTDNVENTLYNVEIKKRKPEQKIIRKKVHGKQ